MDLNDEIRKLAFELYEKSGKIADRDLDNWLEAENIIRSRRGDKRNPETEQSSSPKKKRVSTSKKSIKK